MSNLGHKKWKRLAVWIPVNLIIFVAVAITNGLLVFAIGAFSSNLFSLWMLTAFVLKKDHGHKLSSGKKVTLIALGTLVGAAFAYGHPLYLGLTLAFVIHEMILLDRFGLGAFSAFCAPVVSLVPIVNISHASYTLLTLSSATYQFEAIIGYAVVTILLVTSVALLKRDDKQLLPIVGKTELEYGIEKIGAHRWLRLFFRV